MRYGLEYADSVRDYLRNLSLSRSGRLCICTALIEMAAEVPDAFRLDPANRPDPASPFYHFTQICLDSGRFRTLYVVVDDTTAAYGVLRIVYADCQ
ncbi:MAG TPA: hypothetical protein VEL76_41455 [Gemmataceae bacterium]|nr:hypothetical protein [Gemmataceae bacterium]